MCDCDCDHSFIVIRPFVAGDARSLQSYHVSKTLNRKKLKYLKTTAGGKWGEEKKEASNACECAGGVCWWLT